MQIKLIFTRKTVHLASFWKWGFLELGSGLLKENHSFLDNCKIWKIIAQLLLKSLFSILSESHKELLFCRIYCLLVPRPYFDGVYKHTTLSYKRKLISFLTFPGAQLSMPLPLVRITSASHLEKSDTDGSTGDPSPLYYNSRPLTQSLRKAPIRLGSRKGLRFAKEDVQIIPDVEVN